MAVGERVASRGRRHHAPVGITVAFVVGWLASVLGGAPGARAQPGELVDLSGFGTTGGVAVALSQRTFVGAETVLIGRDDLFADALASGVLQDAAPLLLTSRERVDEAVADEVGRLGASRAVLLGGEQALSADVAAALEEAGLSVTRLEGPSRLETAAAVADEADATGTALLVRAFAADEPTQAFADSLAVGGWSAATGRGIFLSESDRLSDATAAALTEGGFEEVVIVGGEAAVDNRVAADLALLGLSVRRVAGPTRSHTAVEVARERGFTDVRDADTVILVESRGEEAWAAGFAGAAASGAWDAPILLAEDGELAPVTREWLDAATSFAQPAEAPRLVCAVTTELCAEVADLIGTRATATPTPDEEPPGITFAADGDVLHRNAPILATVTGAPRPEEVVLEGPCVDGSPATVPVAADGEVRGRVAAAAAAGTCMVQARADDAELGTPAQIVIVVATVEMPTAGGFNDPTAPFVVEVPTGGPVSGATFDAGCLEADGAAVDLTTIHGTFDGTLGWCSVTVTIDFPDGGSQTLEGPEIPNTYVCDGSMILGYDRPRGTYRLIDAAGSLSTIATSAGAYEVDGTSASRTQYHAAFSHGDCVSLDGTDLASLSNVDTGCPDTLYQTGDPVYEQDEQEGRYTEDVNGLRDVSQEWEFHVVFDRFRRGEATITGDEFGRELSRFDCVRYDLDTVTDVETHTLVNRDWRG